ncbi:heparin lyase I family protein [Sinorhizobium sp. 8-89]|uniref:heparin lyase I family protein n=1 Tax=Sinorhizobium sp. 7-81 TaxID=3049087 RepID=UPI0024C44833|nr:heparin lyase I family protein [Sinorhizobium sp. 7-81]
MRAFLSPVLLAFLAGCTHSMAGPPRYLVSENFAKEPRPRYWFVCHRPENTFKFGATDGSGRTAMVATVRPEPKALAPLREHHAGCIDEDGDYQRDGDERAELWESHEARVPLGTDVWYRFDMFVDDSLKATSKRFVAGQWKEGEAARGGPLVAQRFTGRRFTVTVEQDNLAPKQSPDDVLCRVLVADQLPLSQSPAGWPHDDKAKVVPPLQHRKSRMDFTSKAIEVARDPGCARGIIAQQYHLLPDPFGRWTTMVYHLGLTPDNKAFVEIWANGVKIGRVDGRIGYAKTGARLTQYFKFGPYRDPQKFETVTKLANYVRSTSRNDVDPTGRLAPD